MSPSTRWCPTAEQLMILESMYKGGTRTPNASQIQQITAHLSHYGKIEGKNVFYWFQNHKARDRLKIRKRLLRHHQLLQQQQQYKSLALLHLKMELNYPPLGSYLTTSKPSKQLLHQDICRESCPEMDLLCKLDKYENGGSCTPVATYGYCGDGSMARMETYGSSPSCCRPLKTLDLFPMESTGLKVDVCRSSNSSSSCTSITN